MSARGWVAAASVSLSLLLGSSPAWTESRPLKRLPADLYRWSTVWMTIPQQMVDVGLEDGPLAAITWGPAKGAAKMVEAATQDVWDAVKPEQHHGYRHTDARSQGLVLRYVF